MAEETIVSALVNLGGTGVMVWVLWRLLEKVLERQAEDHKQMIEVLVDTLKDTAAAMQASAVASSRVEKVLDGFPQFIQQVDARLQAGQARFAEMGERVEQGEGASANHERRLVELEKREHA